MLVRVGEKYLHRIGGVETAESLGPFYNDHDIRRVKDFLQTKSGQFTRFDTVEVDVIDRDAAFVLIDDRKRGACNFRDVGDTESFILLQQVLPLGIPAWVRGGIGLHTAAAAIASGAAGVVVDAAVALARESLLPDTNRVK